MVGRETVDAERIYILYIIVVRLISTDQYFGPQSEYGRPDAGVDGDKAAGPPLASAIVLPATPTSKADQPPALTPVLTIADNPVPTILDSLTTMTSLTTEAKPAAVEFAATAAGERREVCT